MERYRRFIVLEAVLVLLALAIFISATVGAKHNLSTSDFSMAMSGDSSNIHNSNYDSSFQGPELPIKTDDSSFKKLKSCHNEGLDQVLKKELLQNPTFKRLIDNNRMSLGVVDLSDWEHPAYADINGKKMMYAASLPKIAVLLAAQDAIYKKEIEETESLKKNMNDMIRYSNNQATTAVIDILGYKKIERVLRSQRYALYAEEEGGGLWVGKRYARSGTTNREPMKNLSHAATVYQVCRFYYMLVFGKLVSFESSKKMLDILKDPGINHKFVHTLQRIAPEASLYRKSGSWKSWHADSILVWDADRKYILVALVEDVVGEQVVRNLVEPVERALNAYKGKR